MARYNAIDTSPRFLAEDLRSCSCQAVSNMPYITCLTMNSTYPSSTPVTAMTRAAPAPIWMIDS